MNRVFIVGNAGMDVTLRVARLPRPGETVVAEGSRRAPGGKGLNQAVVCARSGVPARFLAAIGNDADGREIARWLAAEPFDALNLVRGANSTDISVLFVDAVAENCIVSTCAAADALGANDAVEFASTLRGGDVLLMQGNLSQATTLAALVEARNRGVTTLVNTAPMRWDVRPMMRLCSAVIANAGEAEAITGASALDAAHRLRDDGAGVAIVTLGGEGCVIADRHGARHLPAHPATPVDTAGAGDAFCGTLAAMLASGAAWSAAIDAAQAAGALTVRRTGAFEALPTGEELRKITASAAGAA